MKIRTKTIWVIVLTVVFFLSMSVLGIASVYRVDSVTLNVSVVSDTAEEEVNRIQSRLEEAYDKKSIFSAEKYDAENVLKDFPYFRLTEFRKSYPNRLIVSVTEDAEVYAVSNENGGYYILGEDGLILGVRESYSNRLDGAENVLLLGLRVSGEKGSYLDGDESLSSLLSLCDEMSKSLDGIRRNVLAVEVIRKTSSVEDAIYKVTMREGVNLYIGNPTQRTEEKARAAIEKYLSLSDLERLTGTIAVSESDGKLTIAYSDRGNFDF